MGLFRRLFGSRLILSTPVVGVSKHDADYEKYGGPDVGYSEYPGMLGEVGQVEAFSDGRVVGHVHGQPVETTYYRTGERRITIIDPAGGWPERNR